MQPSTDAVSAEQQRRLRDEAREALGQAYAAYSGFRVGAAVLTERGNVYRGCNVENASYGLSMCAERTAIFSAVVAEGPGMRLRAVAVAASAADATCTPCGACRQVIVEFGLEATVLFPRDGEPAAMRADELLPLSFGLERSRREPC
jgi:cytidine deaminase